MNMLRTLLLASYVFLAVVRISDGGFECDVFPTSSGELRVTFIGHGTLMFEIGRMVIHIDPVSGYADYSQLPKADIVLVTHEHGDHFDKEAIGKVSTEDTVLVLTETCARLTSRGVVMKNGDVKRVKGLKIEAVPAYNVIHNRGPGRPYHPKGAGNGYVITMGQMRFYVAGDTENVPEMAQLGEVDCAFLPMNLPYTMTPEMVADAARTLKPKILYPYHFGDMDTSKLVALLEEDRDIEVRIRKMK